MEKTAKVILRKALTYSVRKFQFKKGVPVVLTGDIVDEIQANGYFSVTLLKSEKKANSKKVLKNKRKVKLR